MIFRNNFLNVIKPSERDILMTYLLNTSIQKAGKHIFKQKTTQKKIIITYLINLTCKKENAIAVPRQTPH